MFQFIHNRFFKKIIFDEDILQSICEISKINWCENVGKSIEQIYCQYDMLQAQTDREALNYLSKETNSKEFVCLENLLIEGLNRSSGYLFDYRREEYNSEWNKISEKADEYVDFQKIIEKENLFNKNNSSSVNLYLSRIVYHYIICLYFKKNDPNFPTFVLDIFDIYKKGHIVVGWKGKFPSPASNNSISKEEGILLVW